MGNTTAYTYFDNGLTATVTRTDSSGANHFLEESNFYDPAGNLVAKVTNNGATTEQFTVDAATRTTQTVLDPSGVNRTTTVSYTPDDKPATTTETDASGATRTTTASYDPMGNLTAKTLYGDAAGHPVGWWKLNQTTGTTVTDSSGTGNTANASGVTWSGGAATFAGTAGQQIATNGPVLNTAGTFSVSAWVKLNNTSGFQTFVVQQANNVGGFYLEYESDTNKWAFARFANDSTSTVIRALSGNTAQTNTWTHLVGVFDSATGAMTLYVNGVASGTATDTTPFNANGPLVIGRGFVNGAPNNYVNGAMDNVQVYSRALASSDISTLYAAGRSGGTVASSSQIMVSRSLDQRGLPTSTTDPNGNVTNYSFDEAGQLAVKTAPTVSVETNGGTASPMHPVTTVGYNTFGEPVENQDPNGNITTTVYDAEGQAVSVTAPNYTPPGSSTPITATTVHTYDAMGNLVATSDPLNNTTHYLYDQLGDLVRTTDPAGGTTTATYDTNGEKLSVTDASGAQTQATYDYLGRPLTHTVLERYPSAVTATTNYSYAVSANNPGGAWLASTTSPNGVVTRSSYNNIGDVVSDTDSASNVTSYGYDFLGRRTVTTLADGTSTAVGYDTASNPTSIKHKDASGNVLTTSTATYDAAGNRLSTTDARGDTSTFTYDATGAMTQEVQPVSATSSITTSFGYDAAGNRTRFTDGRGNAFISTYNSWNKPESLVEPATATYTTAADRTFTTTYDADGHPVSQTQPGGVTVTATYDNLGNLTTQTGAGAEAATATRTFGYDAVGRLTSAATAAIGTSGNAGYVPASNETFGYNDRGELLSANGTGGTSSFGYNADGLMTSRADAAGTTSYGYDTTGRLTTTTEATTGTQLSYSYNALNQVSQIGYGSGANTRSFTYDALHRLTGDTLKTAAGATIASIGYGYDANSNLASKTTTGFTGSTTNTYTYDQANRLTSWNNGNSTVNYGYDASGNRTQVGANVYTYDARDQLTSDGVNTYTYSARGTLTSQTSAGGTATSATDAFGQMISHNGQTYTYDALGRVLTDTPYSGGAITFAYTGTDNTVASDGANTYSYDPSGGLLGVGVAASGGGTVAGSGVLAFTDQHTDVVGQFTATSATLTGSTSYDPLGNVLGSTGQKGQLGYQSGWTDHNTGKVDMAARWYNPATGQFMNRDTVSLDPVPNSAAANPFAYVNDNPLIGTDPSGHGFFDWVGDAWNSVTSTVSSAASWVNDNVIQPAASWVNNNIIQPAVTWVNNNVIQPVVHAVQTVVHHVVDAYHTVTTWVRRAGRWVARKVVQVAHQVVHIVRTAYHAVQKAAHAVVHAVASATHAVGRALSVAVRAVDQAKSLAVQAVGHVATSVATFVKNHATAIASFAAGGAAFFGCEALTLGVGSVGCAALGGAVGNAVAYGMDCHNSAGGCSVVGATESIGLGALAGALGGAVAGALGGRLASLGLNGLLPEVAVQGIVGAGSGAVTGAAIGVANYGQTCGSHCSVAGAAKAAGAAAATGALVGGIAGGSAPLIGRAWAGLKSRVAPRAGAEEDSLVTNCPVKSPVPHSFTGNTPVKLADGSSKPISQVKIGDKIRNGVPGEATNQTHTVGNVIVTTTDHDFVDLTISPDKPGIGSRVRGVATTVGRALAGLAVAATVAVGVGGTATAATETSTPGDAGRATLTTTFHHPFYDITRAAFVDAADLHVGDQLQTDTGTATVTAVKPHHSTAVTYDLTIRGLHTYYVLAGNIPVLVHNCGNTDLHRVSPLERGSSELDNGLNPKDFPLTEELDGAAHFGNEARVNDFAASHEGTHGQGFKVTVPNEWLSENDIEIWEGMTPDHLEYVIPRELFEEFNAFPRSAWEPGRVR